MTKSKLIIFLMGIAVGIVILPLINFGKYKDQKIIQAQVSSPTATPIPTSYPNKDFYTQFFKSEQLNYSDPDYENLNGNGELAVFIVTGEGCASCHYQELYIFKDQQKVFTFYGDDINFSPLTGQGFSITQPVRKDDEPYCCPTEYMSAVYKWDGKTFVKAWATPNWKDSQGRG